MSNPYDIIKRMERREKELIEIVENLNKTIRRQESRMKSIDEKILIIHHEIDSKIQSSISKFTLRHSNTADDATKILNVFIEILNVFIDELGVDARELANEVLSATND